MLINSWKVLSSYGDLTMKVTFLTGKFKNQFPTQYFTQTPKHYFRALESPSIEDSPSTVSHARTNLEVGHPVPSWSVIIVLAAEHPWFTSGCKLEPCVPNLLCFWSFILIIYPRSFCSFSMLFSFFFFHPRHRVPSPFHCCPCAYVVFTCWWYSGIGIR